MSVGELLVRSGIVAARVLYILDGQEHYRKVVQARVRDSSTLELAIASAESQYSPQEMEAAMGEANQKDRAALAELHANKKIPKQQQIKAALEAVVSGVASGKLKDEAGFREVLRLHEAVKRIAVVNVSINYADVMADNARLQGEARQLADLGMMAAQPVREYLEDALLKATNLARQSPNGGVERDVRDYFFLHTLARGQGWGYVMTESGWLLLDGGKNREALEELLTAVHLGYNDPAVKLGIA
ncbi:MAG: hypothetical protein AABX60_01775, partial [Nanoarchaeota archaeon]